MRLNVHKASQKLFFIVFDALLIYFSLYLAYHLRFFSFLTETFPVTKGIPSWQLYKQTLLFIIPLWIFIFSKNGLYNILYLPVLDEIIRIIRGTTIAIFFFMLTTFFFRDSTYSRIVFVLLWSCSITTLSLFRVFAKITINSLMRTLVSRENILIIGKRNKLLKTILKKRPFIKLFFLPTDEDPDIDHIKKFIFEKEITQIVVSSQQWSEKSFLDLYDWCEINRIEMRFVPDVVQICRGEIVIDSSFGIPVFHIKPISLSGFNFYFKRVIDLIISILALSFMWPFLFMIAILIKLDSSGSVLYHHKRMGYRGKVFDFHKFRTMVTDADKLLEIFKNQSERKGPVFKMSNDPRVTKIGKILRRYSIDEFPQLLNVLKGEMSLVGPRPQVLWEAAAYDDWAKRRLRVLPGITGLWQVSGRANLSYEEMIELDIFYIENWSLGLDIEILYRTLPAIFSKKGAY